MPLFNEILVKFTYLVGMIADQNFYDICFTFFYPTASATAYGQRPKFVRAKHSATAEGENCAYGPTLGLPQEQDQGGQTHESICCTSSTT